PTHDLCELLTRAAVAIARNQQGRQIQHFTIPLMGDPREPPGPYSSEVRQIELSPAMFAEKLKTTLEYSEHGGPTLKQEMQETIRRFGEKAFAREYLFAAPPVNHWEPRFKNEKPFYETYGEKQVAAGRYQFVIRFRQHFLPIANRLSVLASSPATQA